MDDWYQQIEPKVREVVRRLRNAGINTVSSCGHEMTIGFDTWDATESLDTIFNVLTDMGFTEWRAGVGVHRDGKSHDKLGAIILRPENEGDHNVIV